MWSHFVARRSAIGAAQIAGRQNWAAVVAGGSGGQGSSSADRLSCLPADHRCFSSYGGDHRGNRNQSRGRHGNRQRKSNFARERLEPAARGQLNKNHQSGVPRTVGKRPKGHGTRSSDDGAWGRDGDFDDGDMLSMDGGVFGMPGSQGGGGGGGRKTGTIAEGSPIEELNAEDLDEVKRFLQHYEALRNTEEVEHYYWKEEDYDHLTKSEDNAMAQRLHDAIETDDKGAKVADVDEDVYNYFTERLESSNEANELAGDGTKKDADINHDKHLDIAEWVATEQQPKQPSKEFETITPLNPDGPTITNAVEAMVFHPTRYAEVRQPINHAESKREPRPRMPKNRSDPPKEFLETYMRFLFVTGLPPLVVDGETGSMDNALHRNAIQEQIADIFGLEPEQVHAANLTSGFIGLTTREDRMFLLDVGPNQSVIESPLRIAKYEPTERDAAFCNGVEDSIVVVDNLVMGSTASLVARTLFPADDAMMNVYGDITNSDVVMKTPNSAIVRLKSPDLLEATLASTELQDRLVELGRHPVRFMKARRNLKYTGRHGGAANEKRLRVPSERLIVDGLDMPTRKFYISHYDTVHLINLDPSVTKKDIAAFFQPFCRFPRDVEGSVEFVTCESGHRTGHAYVGFDEGGEMEAVLEAFPKRRVDGLGLDTVIISAVKDLTKIEREVRQARSEEELLDNLKNWEQYVDPEDIKHLEAHGVAKEMLDSTFRTVRFSNTTFAANDQALRSESLNPNVETGGLFAQFVRQYVNTLKDNLATEEDPGEIYKSLFFQDEEITFEMLEIEKKRQQRIKDMLKQE